MTNIAKVSRQAALQKILDGLATRFAGVSTLTLGGTPWTIVDLEKAIQTELEAIRATAKAKDAYAAQVQVERASRAKVSPTLRLLKNYVLATFGDTQDSVQVLGDFGYSPRPRRKTTVATKAEAVEKAKATREAHGAKGQAKPPAAPPPPPAAPTPHA